MFQSGNKTEYGSPCQLISTTQVETGGQVQGYHL